MASRRTYYFRQKVQPAELNAGFTGLENADWAYAVDTGSFGITAGGAVTQRGAGANMTVDVAGLFTAYDQLGRRIAWTPVQNVDCSVDYLGNPTTVLVGGNNKILSIFAVFTRVDSDPRTDGNGATVQFQNDEGYTIKVVQSSETVSPTAPTLLNPGVLLADVALAFGQTTIMNGNISITRRQDQIVVSGSPQSLRRGLIKTAIADVLGFYNAHVSGSADKHPASAITYAGGGTWTDGTTNPATDVESQLDKIVSDLRGTGGAAKVGTATTSAFADTVTIGPGSVQTVINALITALAGTAGAGKIGTAGASAWKDGTTNPATTIEGQLDKIVTDLINNAGAARIGAATFGTWADSSTVSNPSSIQAGLAAIVNVLGATSGAGKVGTVVTGAWKDTTTVASGTVQSSIAGIVSALASTAGSAKIGHAPAATWFTGTTPGGASVFDQLENIVSNLGGAAGAAKIGTTATGNWADGTPVAAGSVQSALNGIVSALADAVGGNQNGASRIGFDPAGSVNFTAGSTDVDDALCRLANAIGPCILTYCRTGWSSTGSIYGMPFGEDKQNNQVAGLPVAQSVFTAPYAGKIAWASVMCASITSGDSFKLTIYKNGSPVDFGSPLTVNHATPAASSSTGPISFAQGDTLQVVLRTVSGGTSTDPPNGANVTLMLIKTGI